LKIFIINLLTLIVNLILVLIISYKLTKLTALRQDFALLQKNIEELLNETSYLSNTFLENLENKITEGKTLLAGLAEKEANLKKAAHQLPESPEEYRDPITREMALLYKQGKTITEIAQQLKTTKGEVAFRLNLDKKIKAKKS
jgi:DNA-binding NarL/FixJ family response regulator